MPVPKPIAAAAVLLAMLVAIYGPGIGKGFVKDDVVWVGANQVTSWSDLRALLFRSDGFYRPVVAATFAMDRAVYGIEPLGFGVTNLLLLLMGALALSRLGTALGLRATMAVAAAGVWTLNFHAVNMAVLWLSGRTALCVSIAAFVSAACVVKRRPIVAGVAVLVAMLAKEEAVMLPAVLSAWAWMLEDARERRRVSEVVRLTWPTWAAMAVYFSLRLQTEAMTPMTAPANYQFMFAPAALAGNAFEYLDRACTFSLIVIVAAHLVAWARPRMSPELSRLLPLAAVWVAGTLALTVFVPVRSSLYALLPSAAPALVAGFLLQQLWDTVRSSAHRRLVAAAVLLPLLLLPLYWLRNTRWVEIGELSAETFAAVRQVVRNRPDVAMLRFRDDTSTRRSLAATYGELLPEAVRLATGRDIDAEFESPGNETGGAPRIVLEKGRIRLE